MQKPSYYAIIPASVRYDKRLTAAAKLLYGEISALCNQEGYCWATNGYFADLYQVSLDTVSNWIKQLSDSEHIINIVERSQSGTERRIYLKEPFINKYTKGEDFLPGGGVNKMPQTGKHSHPGEDIITPQGTEENTVGAGNNPMHNNTFNNTFNNNLPVKPAAKPKKAKEDCPVYSNAVDAYFVFFKNKNNGIAPKFDAVEGKNMKAILKHLKNISGSWEESLELFKIILDNWEKLDKWYHDKYDIKIIFGQINNIISGLTKRKESIGGKSISDLDNLISSYL